MVIMCWGLQFDGTKPQGFFPAHSNDSLLLLGPLYKALLTHTYTQTCTCAHKRTQSSSPFSCRHGWLKWYKAKRKEMVMRDLRERRGRDETDVWDLCSLKTRLKKIAVIGGHLRSWSRERERRSVWEGVWKWLSRQISVRRVPLTTEVPAPCLVRLSDCIDSLLHWANSGWLTEFLCLAKGIFFLPILRIWQTRRFKQLFCFPHVCLQKNC